MSYLNPYLQKQIAEKLGMHYLDATTPQVMYTKTFHVLHYWAAYMAYSDIEQRKIEWVIAAVKTDLWHRGLIASVDGLKSNILKVAGIPLRDWDDPIVKHLQSVDVMAALNDGWVWAENTSFLEIVFGTTRTQGSFSVNQFPTDSANLDGLWNKLNQTTQFFRILAKPQAFKTDEIFPKPIQ